MNTVEPVAIIGMGCRFPGAGGVEEFWDLLESNTDAVTRVPSDRFDVTALYAPEPGRPDKLISRHGGFVEGLFTFDAAFFGISPREARSMDPQQRLLLQVTWEAFEDAGVPPSSVRGSDAGVFVGQSTAEYAEVTGRSATRDVRAMAGSRLRAVTSGRISHAFDLRGPSLVLDTACSSSLVAVHTARLSLLTGECDLAVAAGVNTVLSPTDAVAYSQGHMLAPDGRCKFGDGAADGFVRSEGVAAVLLKRLSSALADGDPIHALLLGSAVTNDGDGSGLLLRPAVSGQTAMLRAAWRSAGVTPAQVDYVEAHGTGTTVGDGVELRALAEVLRDAGDSATPLPVGSVKTNIGHAEAAAGIAGLIKTVLVAKHRTVPASLHQTSPHPQLTEPGFPVTVVNRNTPLRPKGESAVLGVSSFGLSGTNAHAVVGEYVPETVTRPEPGAPEPDTNGGPGPHLLVLSARTPAALQRLALRWAEYLGANGRGRGYGLRDICRSAATGRDAHPFRLWAVGHSHDALADVLRALAADEPTPDGGMHEAGFGSPREVALVFPGQGSQWSGMGRELLRTSDAFRAAMAECDAAVREELGWSVVELLLDEDAELTEAVEVVQPALWAMEVALAAHWRAMGVDPDLCVGHSMGEAAAACVAGALSVRDAARVICRRSSLMQRLSGRGAMLATELSPQQARELVAAYGDDVCVAVENSPCSTVLAGEAAVLEKIARELERRAVLCRTVKVNVASHSPLMDEIRDDLLTRLMELEPVAPRTEMFSTLRCAPVEGAALDAGYWVDNLRQPVRFAESVQRIVEARDVVFLEVSPHPLLGRALEDALAAGGVSPKVVSTLIRGQSESTAAARALGRAFGLGARVDWRRWYGGDTTRVPLPLYPWEAEHYRAEPEPATARSRLGERRVPLSRLAGVALDAAVTVRGVAHVPPVLCLQAVADTLRDIVGEGPVELRNVRIGDALPSLEDAPRTTAVIRVDEAPADGTFAFRVDALCERSGESVLCVAGTARPQAVQPDVPANAPLDQALTRCGEYVPAAEFYRRAEARGYSVAPALRVVQQMWRREGEAVARLHVPSAAGSGAVEAGLLAMIGAWPHCTAADDPTCAHLPLSFERVLLAGAPCGDAWSLARFTPEHGGEPARCEVVLTTSDGRVLADFQGIRVLRSPGRTGRAVRPPAAAKDPRPRPPAERTSRQEPKQAPPHDSRSAASRLFLHTATVLGTTVDRVDPRRPLRDLGLDSLMAIQLRRVLHQDLGVEIPATRLLGSESAATIAADLDGVRAWAPHQPGTEMQEWTTV
ncbi:acyltransferase domain-containing protein [Streptomyces sp. Li-HN-5-11]|uniref:type I polyketide synthase n=1 Tax=Streptomyces sp. Li-HN-5-11 TaxID=3075432 RepID=UPI0028AEFA90|nr:acyltransferase domain-containing protein [Streptomyces sp. Li-HN-5-11]WNM35891.1 acyltransferase domain-containing protein [Streptomyces sp. Li-HN-5-11]